MANLTTLIPASSTVATDLRKLADEIDAGNQSAHTAIIVFQDRYRQTIGRTLCGDTLTYSGMMGLLAYVQQMLYHECQEHRNE